MNKTIILKRFKEIGLSPYESKTYLSLLGKDILTVSEVSKIAGIPRANSYEALERLMARGMCVSKPGRIKRYSATDPLLLRDKFVDEIDKTMEIEMANLNKKEKNIIEKYETSKKAELSGLSIEEKEILEKNKAAKENIGNMIEELRPQYNSSRSNENPLEYIEIIKEPHQIHKKFIELTGDAKHEILIFTKPPYTGPRKVLEEQAEKQAEPLRQGITIKSIYEMPGEKDELEWWYNVIDVAARRGEKARVIKELPMKMVVFDERTVMLPLKDPLTTDTSFTAQVVQHASLAKGLKILFETMWERAEDYHALKDLL